MDSGRRTDTVLSVLSVLVCTINTKANLNIRLRVDVFWKRLNSVFHNFCVRVGVFCISQHKTFV